MPSWRTIPGSALRLDAGELLVVPQGETHLMGSAVGLAPTPMEVLLAGPIEGLSSLPRLFKIDMRHDPRAARLEPSLKFAAAEAAHSRAGGTIVLARRS